MKEPELTSATVRLSWCGGHRLAGHPKCGSLHGHNYIAEITVGQHPMGAPHGMVIDFGKLKGDVGGWINAEWDHAMVLDVEDREAIKALINLEGQRMAYTGGPPTAETMTRKLWRVIDEMGYTPIAVTIWETPTSFATTR